ncbi:ABC transporter substrate-binding protein [Pseudodesulfovibrio piezophilus]|uniref:histidine kinase n=1 Tax=Pseudodesulfovibrio piezophilus (strain DSM 21447 / JCM 15486 / C1TLV30) TaxID=1322246 RepID=M1WVR9_PSEP2|nr:ABC transporter substrate-binding protein [Pseudodesulfovibrio piezophilus]CCH48703.1 PAS/PAC sensor signal transduction histidine kinase [Pseudodesulfovibrio piezophilus C1TLV30]
MGRRASETRLIPTLTATAIFFGLMLFAAGGNAAPPSRTRPLLVQLKWTHQFQFAGYYAAKAKGYYEERGIDVILRESLPGTDVTEEVLAGRADFGIGDSRLLLDYNQGKPVVVIGAIFQHSPNVIVTMASSGIKVPRDLRGKRVMLKGSTVAPLWAMLAQQGITRDEMVLQTLSRSLDDLINGETDAIPAYITDQPYRLQLMEHEINIINPLTYGIDFYGDCLFTSFPFARKNPELVEQFAKATYKGWVYAMTHTEEIIELIRLKYNSQRSLGELRYEAETMQRLIFPKLISVGSMNRKRWELIGEAYKTIGIIQDTHPLDDFIYISKDRRRAETFARWMPYMVIAAGLIVAAALSLLLFNRRLKRGIDKRTKELNRNRESLRQVIDLVPNMIYAKNREGRFILLNRTMAESLGQSIEALTGSIHAHVHPDTTQIIQMQADENMVLQTNFPKVVMEEPYLHADGTLHWLQTTRLPYIPADSDEPAVLILSVDITKRRESEAALKSSAERFSAIFNQTYQFSAILSLDGTLIQVNEAILDAFEVTSEHILNKPYWETPWWGRNESMQTWLKQAIKSAATGEVVRKIATHELASGSHMVVEFTLKPATNEEGEILFLIAEGRDITSLKNTEEKLRHLNEQLELRVAERTRNLEEAKHELETSLEQLHQTQEELVLSEKLAALGGLVAGVAHEINTPLGIGVTASSFLQERIMELAQKFDTGDLKKSDLKRFIDIGKESSTSILTNLGRAAELIKSFKQVAADQSSEQPRKFNLREYVDEVLLSLRPKYKRTTHSIENHCPDIELFSYPGAIMQIITNLLVNSLTHAYPDGSSGRMIMGGEVKKDMLLFTYSDDGIGLEKEAEDKIFEPFYTTKRGEGGTGLGLHIVFNTVTQTLGGSIQFESSPGEGIKYVITMPLNRSHGSEEQENPA